MRPTTAFLSAAAAALASAAAAGTQVAPATAASGPSVTADPSGARVDRALAAVEAHPGTTKYAASQQLKAVGTVVDADGTSHVRFERSYRGLPVVGGDLVVHQGPAGGWKGASQTLDDTLTLGVTPAVTRSAAGAKALAPSKATRAIAGEQVEGSTLVVDARGAQPRLAWKVMSGGTQADQTPSRLATYVDATTGQVIRTEQEIVNVDGSGQTLYSGTVPLSVTQSGSSYQLKNAGVRGGTYTTDMKNKQDSYICQLTGSGCSNGTLVTSSTTTFGNGTNANRASAAADAQYGSNETWDYFAQVHGRNGIFGNGTGSLNRVHYGNKYVNAFWDGSKMTYGDGDGTSFGPLVSLDVAGHEMSHGVTENTANLTYSGESGGLNEATSDIFGTLVEFYAANANDPADYYIGEEFDLAQGVGFRRMDDPSSDGSSLNCYSATAGSADVHYSSGIGNHFFYLLAEGSGAKTIGGKPHASSTCDGSSVTGIGRDAAGKIWFRALSVYMTSGTTYAGARTATLNAARDLYGASSTESTTVAAAWRAVNVS
ncbi:peptidase [Marmoricola sp. Leaf446]|uniref:M4 family metallopeptidase n=1 Tax=Marmoricola sp. Leaf446 TaxID=1736379 RepID=UPI000701C280|nr:M4 family metallopeptidase [Marmoricola sp. Leaf446]KQT91124.1 peptidase [Marmoricola sp. Leaf446]